jgi:hypothetical protein
MCRHGRVNGRCEFNSCGESAIGVMHAQWTLMDFGEWESCERHISDACIWATRRIVGGCSLANLWWDWYELEHQVKKT